MCCRSLLLLLSTALLTVPLNTFSKFVEEKTPCKNGEYIVTKSAAYHDPENRWRRSNFYLELQEPRIENPHRYSKVNINNQEESFELIRGRGSFESRHEITSDGQSNVSIDGSLNISDELREEFGLYPERNLGYQRFYKLFYGLPMSLTDDGVEAYTDAKLTEFNDDIVYSINVELKQPMISKRWRLYISMENYSLVGLDLLHTDSEDSFERVEFEKEIVIDRLVIPRIRHWIEFPSTEYLGSDLIISGKPQS